jgi:hypothetical protein
MYGRTLSRRGWGPERRPCYLAMSQRPAATTAVQATDIASESAMSFAHSQIVTVQFQSAPCRTALSLNLRAPLEVDAHSATRFTGEASHREKQNADRADRAFFPRVIR